MGFLVNGRDVSRARDLPCWLNVEESMVERRTRSAAGAKPGRATGGAEISPIQHLGLALYIWKCDRR